MKIFDGGTIKALIKALQPYGPAPIVFLMVCVGAFTALALHADPLWTFVLATTILVLYILWDQMSWRRKITEEERHFDNALTLGEKRILEKLERRLVMMQKTSEQNLFLEIEEKTNGE